MLDITFKDKEGTLCVCSTVFFITLISLSAQIRGAQTRYTVVNFSLNQPQIKPRQF